MADHPCIQAFVDLSGERVPVSGGDHALAVRATEAARRFPQSDLNLTD